MNDAIPNIKPSSNYYTTSNRVMVLGVILILIFCSFFGSENSVSAQTINGTSYYVSPSGADSNPGTLSQPWKTI